MTDRYTSSVRNSLERIEGNKWVIKISFVLPNVYLEVLDCLIQEIEDLEKEIWRNKNE